MEAALCRDAFDLPQTKPNNNQQKKMSKDEAALDFGAKSAQQLHDQVRAFAGWPGTTAALRIVVDDGAADVRSERRR